MKIKKYLLVLLLVTGTVTPAICSALPQRYLPASKAKLGIPVSFIKLETGERDEIVSELNRGPKYPYLGDVWEADLNGDGLKDFVIYASHMGNGIPPDNGIILFQTASGAFRRLDFETYGFDPADFTDLDRDGRPEIIISSLYQDNGNDGRLHSFWVYAAYGVENYSLKRMDFGKAGFPSFIWFTEKPNSQETTKLSESQKKTYYASLPSVIP